MGRRKMSIARQIRIQRLQDKNRMVGQTFNPSGITAEELKAKDEDFRAKYEAMTFQERVEVWNKIKAWDEVNDYSWPRAWCLFEQEFVFNGEVVH